jgi:hypothetical protein
MGCGRQDFDLLTQSFGPVALRLIIEQKCRESLLKFFVVSSHFRFRFDPSFAILIALTFFMIRRSVALSAELNVVLAIAELYYSIIQDASFQFGA